MAGISSITGTSISTEFRFSGNNTQTGSAYTGQIASADIRKTVSHGTAVANAASGGGDEVFSFQQTIAGAGSATIDLNAMTNMLAQTSVAIVRVKAYQIRLLSAAASGASSADDSTVTTPVASSITVTNNGPTLPSQLDFGSGGSGLTIAITQAAGVINSVAIGAAGSGYPPSSTFVVSVNQSGGSGGVVSVNTNASGVPTSVAQVTNGGGAGYANATVPSTVLGSYVINSGGAHLYCDPLAAGFLTVSATSRNIKVFNNDATNTATIEVDVMAATT